MKKKSFFEKITGVINTNNFDDYEELKNENNSNNQNTENLSREGVSENSNLMSLDEEDAQLTVDVYQTPDHIIVQTMAAGVNPDNLDVQISRDMVTIKGTRHDSRSINQEDFFYKELFWGTFSRTILLPSEVEVEEAEAFEDHGLLTLKLPKIDKDRKTKLKIKTK